MQATANSNTHPRNNIAVDAFSNGRSDEWDEVVWLLKAEISAAAFVDARV